MKNQRACAPVVLLMFRRPELTQRVFDQIRLAKPSQLFLVADGPRPGNARDESLVRATRSVVENVDWECKVHQVFAEENMGLKSRISSGLDYVFSAADRAIILEDDCLPDLTFFLFASELLERYAGESSVGTIGGTSRLRGAKPSASSYDFSNDLRIWGWATWARTWTGFSASGDLDGQWTPQEKAGIAAQVPPGPRQRSIRTMLSIAESLDSWALPFLVHSLRSRYLSVVPEVNLVENIGFGAESTHTQFESFVAQVPAEAIGFPLIHPATIQHNPAVDLIESTQDRRFLIRYILRNPFDVAKRVWRYALRRTGGH